MKSVLLGKRGMMVMSFAVLFGFILFAAVMLSGVVMGVVNEDVKQGYHNLLVPEKYDDPENPDDIPRSWEKTGSKKSADLLFKEVSGGSKAVWEEFVSPGAGGFAHEMLFEELSNRENRKQYLEQGLKKDHQVYDLNRLWDTRHEMDETMEDLYKLTKENKGEYKDRFQDFLEHVTYVDEVLFEDGAFDSVDEMSYDAGNDVLEIKVDGKTTKLPIDNLKDVKKIEFLENGNVKLTMTNGGDGDNGGEIELKPGDELQEIKDNGDGTYTTEIGDHIVTVGDDGWVGQNTKDGNDVFEYTGNGKVEEKSSGEVFSSRKPDDSKVKGRVEFDEKTTRVTDSKIEGGIFNGDDENGKGGTVVHGEVAFKKFENEAAFSAYKPAENEVAIFEGEQKASVRANVEKVNGLRLNLNKEYDFLAVAMSGEQGEVPIPDVFKGTVPKDTPVVVGDVSENNNDGKNTGRIFSDNIKPLREFSQQDDSADDRVAGDPGAGQPGGGEQPPGGAPPGGAPPGGEGGGGEPEEGTTWEDQGNAPAGECVLDGDNGYTGCPSHPDTPWEEDCSQCPLETAVASNDFNDKLNDVLNTVGRPVKIPVTTQG